MDYLAILLLITTVLASAVAYLKNLRASLAETELATNAEKYDRSLNALDRFATFTDTVYNSFKTPGITGDECSLMATNAAAAWAAAKAAGPEISEFLKQYEPVKK